MNKLNVPGASVGTMVRALMTVVAAINVILGYNGWHLIPLNDSDASTLINGAIVLATIFIWLWGFWKNNSFTAHAQIADDVLNILNSGALDAFQNREAA